MIESLTIKSVASYGPSNDGLIDKLKKVNFFFGPNGSGKSTIAKYLYNLSLDEDQRSGAFNNCSQTGYDPISHEILVFDENFVDINFNKKPHLNGVFSLNQQNEEVDRKIRDQEELNRIRQARKLEKEKVKNSIEADKAQRKKELLESCWSKRSAFSTFSKISLSYSGSKPNHLNYLIELLKKPLTDVPSLEQLTNSYRKLYESELVEVTNKVDSTYYRDIRRLERQIEALLEDVIVGNEDVGISELIEHLNSRSWVEEGVKILEKSGDTCPFCQQKTITETLRRQFEEYFDLTYKQKIGLLQILSTNYNEIAQAFLENILQLQNQYNPQNLVAGCYVKMQKLFEANQKVFARKIKHANEKLKLQSLDACKPELSAIIHSINRNNRSFLKLDEDKSAFVSQVWSYMAKECENDIRAFEVRETKYKRLTDLADVLIERYKAEILESSQTIEALRSKTINTKDAVDNINLILKHSGFDSFEIAEKEKVNNISFYFLKRPNSSDQDPIFKSLSEGEKSFISFLYFYQLCIGASSIQGSSLKKKIVVIDDPVSSLDSQALFVVSALINQLILRRGATAKSGSNLFKNENIDQVFILTHNLYFYKEVSLRQRHICTDFWHYRVQKIKNVTFISGQRDKAIHDDYSLLWETIRDLKNNLPNDSKLNIVIANAMRRIIETYVNFIGLGNDPWAALLNEDKSAPEYYLKSAFVSAINDESHKVAVLDSVYFQKVSSEQPQVLFEVFRDIFRTIGKEHYELMMSEEIAE